MPDALLIVLRAWSDAAIITASRDPLDISVACRRLRERIESAAADLGWRLVYADTLHDAYAYAARAREKIIILLDALAAYTEHLQALREAMDVYTEKPGDTLVTVTRPYLDRGVHVAVEGDRLGEIDTGAETFAGIIVSKREALLERLRGAATLHELLASLRGAPIHYWREPWLRLEKPQDPLFYAMLIVSRLRGVNIAPGARVSPTVIIEGPVLIEEGVTIDHYAVIKGPVVACRGSFIGLHATVRGYTLLEPSARIGAYSETYVTLMEPGSSSSSHTYLTGSIIGEDAHVEPFTVTKVVYGEAAGKALGVLAPIPPEVRVGAVLAAKSRVRAGSVIEPLAVIQ